VRNTLRDDPAALARVARCTPRDQGPRVQAAKPPAPPGPPVPSVIQRGRAAASKMSATERGLKPATTFPTLIPDVVAGFSPAFSPQL